MRTIGSGPSSKVRGGGVIGLLVVVVIIMVVILYASPLSKDEVTKVTMAQTQMDKSRDVTCKMNMNNVRTRLAQLQLSSPGAPITPKVLEKKGILPPCPDHGEYIYKNGTLYCTKHSPPPPDVAPAGASEATAVASAPTPVAPAQ